MLPGGQTVHVRNKLLASAYMQVLQDVDPYKAAKLKWNNIWRHAEVARVIDIHSPHRSVSGMCV